MTTPTAKALQVYSYTGLCLMVLLVCGIGGWAAWASISGAVIANGSIVVESNSKKVQHVDGGIVSEIHVKDGQQVKAGDLLLRLDETETRANLAIINAQLNELQASHARLQAERDEAQTIDFSERLTSQQKADLEIKKILSGQRKLFRARRLANQGKKDQLSERIGQLQQEITGLKAQQVSKQEQVKLILQELTSLKSLREKELVPVSRVLVLEREAAKLKGERGEHIASISRAQGQIGETRLRIIQIDQDQQTEVLTQLRETQTKIAELTERRIAAETKLKRTEIRAPQSGFVHQLNVHTIGGVISPREPAMLIIPEQDELVIEARVEPQHIDQVKIGQDALLRFSAFAQGTTPELNGEVITVSADLMRPRERDNMPPYYSVRVALAKNELKRLGNRKLIPGMPAEVFIKTGQRTALSYLLKPLSDQMMRSFREQ
ncbi:MAG: HlyD family type I secretion periplasmic adaptor subunit [Pseudomonadota bacterium]